MVAGSSPFSSEAGATAADGVAATTVFGGGVLQPMAANASKGQRDWRMDASLGLLLKRPSA